MAKAQPQAQIESTPVTSYSLLAERVMRLINSARGDTDRHVHLERLGAYEADWELLLSEIEENDNVTIAQRDDGSVDLFWKVPKDF
ncbi:DUF1654 domain-containing protein [Pseudomonas benzopyrenica]|uniref:DUF1654 domain-containing protein n=1 Tax=Pseudomonas benzopyrenica TaxID=2993566 RepID=A0ABZ2FPF1_9PSED